MKTKNASQDTNTEEQDFSVEDMFNDGNEENDTINEEEESYEEDENSSEEDEDASLQEDGDSDKEGDEEDDPITRLANILSKKEQERAKETEQAPQEEVPPIQLYQPTEEELQQVLEGGEEGVKAFSNVIEKVRQDSFQIAKVLQTQLINELRPYIQMANSMKETNLRQEFFASNQDLEGLDPLVDSVISQLKAEKFQASDKKQLFSEIAKRTKKQLNLVQKRTGSKQNKGNDNNPKMARLPQNGGARPGKRQTSSEDLKGSALAKSLFG